MMSQATGRRGARWTALFGLLGLFPGATPVSAQKVSELPWSMQDARGGFCIWYLVDPEMAPLLAEKGTTFAPAGTGSTLPNALAQTIRDEPRFTSWIPAAICVLFYGRITIGDNQPILASAEQPLTLVAHLVAAQAPRGAGGAGFLLLKLGSDNRVVRHQGGDPGLPIAGMTVVAGKDRGTPEDRVEFRLEDTQITWVGHPSGEPSVGTTRSMSFGYAGARSTNWQGSLETTPAETHVMIGSLRIEGKSLLSKALKSSPIRAVGPIETGGTGRFSFRLVPSRSSGGN
jgi:hypothetical protein